MITLGLATGLGLPSDHLGNVFREEQKSENTLTNIFSFLDYKGNVRGALFLVPPPHVLLLVIGAS